MCDKEEYRQTIENTIEVLDVAIKTGFIDDPDKMIKLLMKSLSVATATIIALQLDNARLKRK